MKETMLPPLLESIENGDVVWKEINHGQIGYLLSCHLIIEKYLEDCIKLATNTEKIELTWGKVRLTFNEKLSLLSKIDTRDNMDCIPAIKRLNKIRNDISHNIHSELNINEFVPLIDYLNKIGDTTVKVKTEDTNINEVLGAFTVMVCAYLGGRLSSFSKLKPHGKKIATDESEKWASKVKGPTPN